MTTKWLPFMRFSRLTRIKAYLIALESRYKPSKRKQKKVAKLKAQLDKTLWKASIATWIRNLFNVIIYASVITAFSSFLVGLDLTFLREQINLVSSIIGGTTIAIIGSALANRFINLYLVDLFMIASTVVAIYTSPEDEAIDVLEIFTEN